MSNLLPSRELENAIFADLVYHSKGETVKPPPGWVLVGEPKYDKDVGYYAEVWGKPLLNGQGQPMPGGYSEISIVNRGTVFSEPGRNTTAPHVDLQANWETDQYNTLKADTKIIFSFSSEYIDSANSFAFDVADRYRGVPITTVGQSLGGATAISQTAYLHNSGFSNVSANTFNALPFGTSNADITPEMAALLAPYITNYYVGNEILTQNFGLDIAHFGFQGTPIGTTVYTPSEPSVGNGVLERWQSFQFIHDAPAAVASLLRKEQGDALSQEALDYMRAVYPDTATTPAQLQTLLYGIDTQDDNIYDRTLYRG